MAKALAVGVRTVRHKSMEPWIRSEEWSFPDLILIMQWPGCQSGCVLFHRKYVLVTNDVTPVVSLMNQYAELTPGTGGYTIRTDMHIPAAVEARTGSSGGETIGKVVCCSD
jgi:hypothetical protein